MMACNIRCVGKKKKKSLCCPSTQVIMNCFKKYKGRGFLPNVITIIRLLIPHYKKSVLLRPVFCNGCKNCCYMSHILAFFGLPQ